MNLPRVLRQRPLRTSICPSLGQIAQYHPNLEPEPDKKFLVNYVQVEHTYDDYVPKNDTVPLSPLLFPRLWRQYAELHRKSRVVPMGLREPTPVELCPYAQILAEPVRQSYFNSQRLPRFFLIRFLLKQHPENENEFLALPYEIKKGEKLLGQRTGPFALPCKKSFIETITRGAWRKIIWKDMLNKTGWRADMPQYIERLYQQRAETELVDLGDEWKVVSEDPVGTIVWKGDGEYEKETFYAETLFGEERAANIQQSLGFDGNDSTPIPRTLQGVEAFKWLWKLRMYQRG